MKRLRLESLCESLGGTPDRTRTCGLLLRRQALYPLSYGRAVWVATTGVAPQQIVYHALAKGSNIPPESRIPDSRSMTSVSLPR